VKSKSNESATELPSLSERAQILLKTLVEKYIDDGLPVGSKTLVTQSGLDVSSATIRKVMADLETMGLVASPHTSSGRVPTELGYRMFVDSLVVVKPIHELELMRIEQGLVQDLAPKELAITASDILSGITGMASIVMLPRRQHNSFRHIEFLPLSDNRILAIIVENECDVKNRILHTHRTFSQAELEQIANYLNAEFVGKDIQNVRENLLTELHQAQQDVNNYMVTLLEMADRLFPESDNEDDVFVAGRSNLLTYQEMANTENMRQLFEAFKGKKDMLELLDQCLVAEETQIFIGSETGNHVLGDCSIVTSPYAVDDVVGVLGVIGPTRMSYDKVIPIVDVTAKLFASALQNK